MDAFRSGFGRWEWGWGGWRVWVRVRGGCAHPEVVGLGAEEAGDEVRGNLDELLVGGDLGDGLDALVHDGVACAARGDAGRLRGGFSWGRAWWKDGRGGWWGRERADGCAVVPLLERLCEDGVHGLAPSLRRVAPGGTAGRWAEETAGQVERREPEGRGSGRRGPRALSPVARTVRSFRSLIWMKGAGRARALRG